MRRSGAGAADVKKYEDELKRYDFLSWLNQSTKLRDTYTNFQADVSESDDESITKRSVENDVNDIDEDNDEDERNDENEDEAVTRALKRKVQEASTYVPSKQKSTRNDTSSASKVGKSKWRKGNSYTTEKDDSTHSSLLKSICESMECRNKRAMELHDSSSKNQDELFGKMIAGELHQLSPILKIQLKHKISDLIFQYQLREATGEGHPKAIIQSTTARNIHPSHTTPNPLFSRSNQQVLTSPIQSTFTGPPNSVSPSPIEPNYLQEENSIFPIYKSL